MRFVTCLCIVIACIGQPALTPPAVFRNPVFKSQDPWVTRVQGYYYYSESSGRSIQVRRSTTLTGLAGAPVSTVWRAPDTGSNSQNVWAPEIHYLSGSWYIYYCADDGRNDRHRLFVLKADDQNPLGRYHEAATGTPSGGLAEASDSWAIDPNVFSGPDKQLYLTWSGWAIGTRTQCIFIASMRDPEHLAGPRVLLSRPAERWETRTAPINEGPTGYTRNGVAYITYSASASWTTDYAVGLLACRGARMLEPASWTKYGPILDHHSRAYGPGSVVFAPSPDDTETWMLYHGIDSPNCKSAYDCRDIRMQRIRWNADGTPDAGYAVDPDVPLRAPSGDEGRFGWGAALDGSEVAGDWHPYRADSILLSPGAGESRVFRGGPLFDCSVSADARALLPGAGRGPASFGLAISGSAGCYARFTVDAPRKRLWTHLASDGKDLGWQTTSLPGDYSTGSFHNLRIDRSGDRFRFLFDGRAVMGRNGFGVAGQMELLANGTGAAFRHAVERDGGHGWGSAAGDVAEGQTGSEGARTADWSTPSAVAAETRGRTARWHTLFRGNPNLPGFTVSASVQPLDAGPAGGQSKYGIVACWQDAHNHAEMFIDRQSRVLTTHAVVGGTDQQWLNSTLPETFDFAGYHRLTANKDGPLFTFLVDGVQMQRRRIELENGQPGLVTDSCGAQYSNFTTHSLP